MVDDFVWRALQDHVVDVALHRVRGADLARLVLPRAGAAAADVGADGPLGAATGDGLGALGGFGDGHQPGHGDVAALGGVAGGAELLAVVAALLRQLGVGAMGVHQDREALAGGPIDGALAGGGHPGGGMRALAGLGQQLDVVELPVFALVADAFVGPARQHDLDGFAEALGALGHGDAEGLELDPGEAAAGAEVDPAAGEMVEQRDLLGEAQGVVERGQGDGGADPEAPGLGGGERGHHVHRGADREAGEVVLGQPHGVEPGLVHDLQTLDGAGVDVFQGQAPVGQPKNWSSPTFMCLVSLAAVLLQTRLSARPAAASRGFPVQLSHATRSSRRRPG